MMPFRSASSVFRRLLVAIAFGLVVAGCAAHEIYERPGANVVDVRTAAVGRSTDGNLGEALIRRRQIVGTLAVDPDPPSVRGMTADQWEKARRQRESRQSCMEKRGYRYLGVPVVERL